MRILKEIDKAGIKITFFSWNGKISVKFERDLVEIIYKFRDGSGIDHVDAAEAFVDEKFIAEVDESLAALSRMRFQRWQTWHPTDAKNHEFEVII